MTDAERDHILVERLGIMCGAEPPTPRQLALARQCVAAMLEPAAPAPVKSQAVQAPLFGGGR